MRREIIKCDWCGLEKEIGIVYRFDLVGDRVYDESGIRSSSYRLGRKKGEAWDICPACKRKLLKFIKEQQKNYRS